jgi:hypothetical protein
MSDTATADGCAGVVNYAPGSFFIAANDGNYQAWWGI